MIQLHCVPPLGAVATRPSPRDARQKVESVVGILKDAVARGFATPDQWVVSETDLAVEPEAFEDAGWLISDKLTAEFHTAVDTMIADMRPTTGLDRVEAASAGIRPQIPESIATVIRQSEALLETWRRVKGGGFPWVPVLGILGVGLVVGTTVYVTKKWRVGKRRTRR